MALAYKRLCKYPSTAPTTPRGLFATGRIALTILNGLRIRSAALFVCLFVCWDFGDPISFASHSPVSDNRLPNFFGEEWFGGHAASLTNYEAQRNLTDSIDILSAQS